MKGDDGVSGLIDDILVFPVLRRVLRNPIDSSLDPNSVILARVHRTEPRNIDALLLGLLLMSHAEGQVVVPDFGFYGRDIHSGLIREERLIAGVNFLAELSKKLRRTVLLINGKTPSGTTVEDAEELAKVGHLARGCDGSMDFVAKLSLSLHAKERPPEARQLIHRAGADRRLLTGHRKAGDGSLRCNSTLPWKGPLKARR